MEFKHYYKSRQGEMVNLLKKLVILESPSLDKEAVDKCSSFAVSQFKKARAKITTYPQKKTGDFHLIEFPLKESKEAVGRLAVLTHIDTVWQRGKIKDMPFYVSGKKVFGPGVLDMKAGLVMAIFALRALNELNIAPRKKISLFINSAEEIGSDAANELIAKLAKRSSAVLCLEPALPGGALKVERKGRMEVCLKSLGKAAHAGTPEEGVSAVEELLFQLRQVQKIRTKTTSMNIGIIKGGERVNIIPAEASAHLDVRFWKSAQKDRVIRYLKDLQPSIKGATIKHSVESYLPPMEKTKASEKLLNQVMNIANSMKISLEAGRTGGGSDASIAANMGVPTLDGLGPDGEGIHAENEHLLIPSLIERTALLTELFCQL
jgi:glutamate carboxypeptidase